MMRDGLPMLERKIPGPSYVVRFWVSGGFWAAVYIYICICIYTYTCVYTCHISL